MEYYLSPLHSWLGKAATWLCGDPVMAGHWLMLLQLTLAIGFVFLAVQTGAGFIPACFAVIWLLHTRNTMQRITAGLQRGWAPGLFAAYAYFLLKGNHKAVWATLFVGCILHPPSAFAMAIGYWLFLLYKLCRSESRSSTWKVARVFAVLNPLYALVTYWAVAKPAHLGKMTSYSQALLNPAFSQDGGRFRMVPHWTVWDEWRTFAFQSFRSSLHREIAFMRPSAPYVVAGLLAILLIAALIKKRDLIPTSQLALLVAIVISYFASRVFAFHLFVPQRYIQIPFTMFYVVAIPVALWRLFEGRRLFLQVVPLVLLAGYLWCMSGHGLHGDANFNKSNHRFGGVWKFARQKTAMDSIFAGHPTLIDGMFLFGEREAFVTTETAHPFYDKYFEEISRRLKVSFRAHFAEHLDEIPDILEPEGIDYFVFERKSFYPAALKKPKYFRPIREYIQTLTTRPYTEYAYKKIPPEMDLEQAPYQVFRDNEAVIIDIAKLREFISRPEYNRSLG